MPGALRNGPDLERLSQYRTHAVAPAPLGGGSRSPSRMGMIEKLEGPGSLEAVCMEQHPYQPNACGSVRKELPNEDAAKLFYRVADDFATRRAENG